MKVVVYGASGRTGVLTAKALERRGISFALAGRSRAKLDQLSARLAGRPEVRVAALEDRAALVRALGGADAVINCAGPYNELGFGVADAALEARCHYFDVTGEHTVLRAFCERFDDDARRRGVALAPAFAAKGALGDWGATALASGRETIAEVAIAYAHGPRNYFTPSSGSMLSAAGQGFFKARDEHDPRASVARQFRFPPPFGPGFALLVPGPEDITLPRHLSPSIVRSYLSLAPGSALNEPWAKAMQLALPLVPAFSKALQASRSALETLLREPAGDRVFEPFMASIEVTSGELVERLAVATHDAYAVTAEIVAYGVESLAHRQPPSGVVPASVFCDPRRALRDLARAKVFSVVRWRGDR